MARPLYAEPRLPAGQFGGPDAEAVCEDCSNCTGPQVTGAEGVVPDAVGAGRAGALERQGASQREVAEPGRTVNRLGDVEDRPRGTGNRPNAKGIDPKLETIGPEAQTIGADTDDRRRHRRSAQTQTTGPQTATQRCGSPR